MIYLISYDLTRAREEDYPDLLNALRADGAVRILYSEWLVQSNERAAVVGNRYAQHMDQKDRLFVCEVTQNSAYYNLQNEQLAEQKFFPLLRAA